MTRKPKSLQQTQTAAEIRRLQDDHFMIGATPDTSNWFHGCDALEETIVDRLRRLRDRYITKGTDDASA